MRSDHERRRLEAVLETGLLEGEPSPALDRAARLVRVALDAPVALVTLVDAERQFFAAAAGSESLWGDVRETPLSHAYCHHVVVNRACLIVDDAARDHRFRDHPGHVELSIVAYAGVPIRTDDGHVLGSLCAIDTHTRAWSPRDLAILEDTVQWVSEEMDLRRKLARARASTRHLSLLHESLRRTQDSTASSARATLHDLRSPLTALAIGLDHLSRVVREDPVNRLVDALHRNLEYIGSLVDTASEELGVGPIGIIDAAHIVASVRDHVSIPEGIELQIDVQSEPSPVRFAKVLLRRCLVNVTENALRFAKHAVTITQALEADEVVIHVDDDGPGMPRASDYARIGEPYLRLHAREGFSGSGLGLSIAARLLGDHGGQLSGEPSPRGGARLELRLPLARSGEGA